jgi:hypothetical protein
MVSRGSSGPAMIVAAFPVHIRDGIALVSDPARSLLLAPLGCCVVAMWFADHCGRASGINSEIDRG